MEEIWDRIDTWLRTNAPKIFDTLQPGASDSLIRTVENTLSIQLPEDFKASCRIHNGQLQSEHFWGLIPEAQEFLSLESLQGDWQTKKGWLDEGDFDVIMSSPDRAIGCAPGIRSCGWSPKWIPLTWDGDGNHYCLDLAPDEGGTFGQIISWMHDSDIQEIIAHSFRSWLEEYAAKLESGEYVFSEEHSAFQGIMSLKVLKELEKPMPRPLPAVDTVVTTKSITIGIYDGQKRPPNREDASEDKNEVALTLNGETIFQNILLDSARQFYNIELVPGFNSINVNAVHAKSEPVMPFVIIDKPFIHPNSPKSEHHFALGKGQVVSFSIAYVAE
jgi:cell wall assembly regulator SMI1